MKTIHILLMAAALLLGFTSCSDDTEGYGCEKVQLSVSVAGSTRTMPHIEGKDCDFANGDTIRLIVGNKNNPKEYLYQYVTNDGTPHWKPLGEWLAWQPDMQIRAVYPNYIKPDANIEEISDQSEEAAFLSSDYMKCEMLNVNKPDDGILRITMERQRALLQVRYFFANELEGQNPQILGVNVKTVNGVDYDGNLIFFDYTAYKAVDADGGVTYNVLATSVQAYEQEDFLRFDVKTNSGQRSFVLRGIPKLDKGNKYLVNVMVGRDKAVIESITAEPWTELGYSDLTPGVKF